MRTAALALASVLVSMVLVGSIAYGTGWFGSAAAQDAPDSQNQTALQNEEEEGAHAWLGILAVNNNEERAARLGASTTQGVIVVQVVGEPAEEAGLQRGDIITGMDDVDITDMRALREALAARSPGDVVTITYIREGTLQTAQATLGERPLRPAYRLLHKVRPLPKAVQLMARLLGGQPLERLVTSTTVLEGDDGSLVTLNALGGTVTAVQPATDTTPGTLTVQPRDGSPEETITLGEGVLLLKRLHPVDLSKVQVGDRVIVGEVLVDGEPKIKVVLVGTLVFGPEGRGWQPRMHPNLHHLLQRPDGHMLQFQMGPEQRGRLQEMLPGLMQQGEQLREMLPDLIQQLQERVGQGLGKEPQPGGVVF